MVNRLGIRMGSVRVGALGVLALLVAGVSVAGEAGEATGAPHAKAKAKVEAVSEAEAKSVAARAQAVIVPVKTGLRDALMAAVAGGNVAAGIEACKAVAPQIAGAANAGAKGVEVGRTSSLLRNPANAPKPWMLEQIAAFEKMPRQAPGVHRTVRLNDKLVGYAEPIYIDAPCLKCHGAPLAPDVEQSIRALYPRDSAKGYKVDQLRGIFWAEVDVSMP